MPDNTLSTLTKIITKVRRLTNTPSLSQMSDDVIKEYINTFVLYDFPSTLKPDEIKTNLEFYTSPYIDTYQTSDDVNNPLYNFKNLYTQIEPPVYISGLLAKYCQDQTLFYRSWPKTMREATITSGDGATTNYASTLANIPVLASHVLFSSMDANYNGLRVSDDGSGNLVGDCLAGGTINYITGVYDFTFTAPPKNGENITVQAYSYNPSKPTDILFFRNKFIVRPVPDGVYKISVQCFVRPVELLAGDQLPELAKWWQYIAYGAAKKVLEDRMDMDSIAKIMPEFTNQQNMVFTDAAMQASSQRTATIYSNPNKTKMWPESQSY